MPVDNVLKLYSKTIESKFLHYGFWNDPEKIKLEDFSLNEIKNAQKRYIQNLTSYIPNEVKLILDVGCGIGGNALFLINQGYNVETLSPDDYQRMVIEDTFKGSVPFYHTKFESFNSKKQYDLILQSESASYIKINKGFKKAFDIIKPGGYLLASDYFVYHNDNSKSPHLKSSHNLDNYLLSAEKNGFEVISKFDQTKHTMPTLDYAKYFLDRFINPILEYGKYSASKNFPKLFYLAKKSIANQIEAKKRQMELIDSIEFKKYRKYMIYLFKKKHV
tara:strand:- start:271 stop:1098 length:828 start_codon:yes stop_codon:yes gene_type:complete